MTQKSSVRKLKNVNLVNYNSIILYAILCKICYMKPFLQDPLKNILTLPNWEKISRENYFLDFSNSSPIFRFRKNKQHP